MESVEAWDRRLGWAFDLVSDDAGRRERAHERLRGAQRRYAETWIAINKIWQDEGISAVPDEMWARNREAQRRTLPEALWDCPRGEGPIRWDGLTYALLYLEWEARHPLDWTALAKGWGVKQALLERLTSAAPFLPDEVADRLVDLIRHAVRREHRCKDGGYAVLARAIGGARLRPVLTEIADGPGEISRLRARYLLWMFDQPEPPKSTKGVWRTWACERLGTDSPPGAAARRDTRRIGAPGLAPR